MLVLLSSKAKGKFAWICPENPFCLELSVNSRHNNNNLIEKEINKKKDINARKLILTIMVIVAMIIINVQKKSEKNMIL